MSDSIAATFREFAESTIAAEDVHRVGQSVRIADIPRLIQDEEAGKNRAISFERIEGYDGQSIGNLFGAADRIFKSTGAGNADEFFRNLDEAIRQPQKIVTTDQDNGFIRSSDPRLLSGRLPPVVHSKEDSSPYITSGVVVTRHPVTGRHHLCFIRMAIVGNDTVLFNATTPRIREISRLTTDAGLPLDVLVLIGAPPKVLLSGALHLPDEVDELEVVQKWAGEDLTFAQAPLPVPCGTEMVLIGQVLPEFRQEGPFGDSFGTYSTRQNPVCKISEVWHQEKPLYHILLGGVSNEHVELLVLKAKHELEHLRNRWDGLLDYALPLFAGGRLCILKVAGKDDARIHLNDLFRIPLIRTIILVDIDIDITSEKDILWSVTRRTKGQNSYDFFLDERGPVGIDKVVIDARAADLSDWNNCRIAPAVTES